MIILLIIFASRYFREDTKVVKSAKKYRFYGRPKHFNFNHNS